MQSTSSPGTGPLAALAASFGITDTTPARNELCIRDGLLGQSSAVYSLAAPTERPGGLEAYLAQAEKYRARLGGHQVIANLQKWRWEQAHLARGRASLQVRDALLLSLEQNAPHISTNVRARAVINLVVTHHAARPMTAGLLRTLRDAEANRFRDFKDYSDFRDRLQIDRKYDPSPSVAKQEPMLESDFLRGGANAALDDDEPTVTIRAPKSGTLSSSADVAKPSAS